MDSRTNKDFKQRLNMVRRIKIVVDSYSNIEVIFAVLKEKLIIIMKEF